MSIQQTIETLKKELPENVKLVAVSKTKPEDTILDAYAGGHKVFGENKIQELTRKYENLPKDIEWHFIGHLQRNKVKYIAPFVSLIHAVDSLKLLKMINKEGKKNKRKIPCLLQMHIAEESSKFGFDKEGIIELLESDFYKEAQNDENVGFEIVGLMGMATFTEDMNQVRNEFKRLKNTFEELKADYFNDNTFFKELSMGMSGDYKIAVEESSTMIRIGSTIFGARNY